MDEEYLEGKYYDVRHSSYDFVGCILQQKKGSELIFQEMDNKNRTQFRMSKNAAKIKQFRSETIGKEEISSYPHTWIRNFDKDYHFKIAKRLGQFRNHPHSTFSPSEIIQFLRGENFWHFSRIFLFLLSNEQQGRLLTNCIKAYLPFIIQYITEFEDVETHDVYESPKAAYMSAFHEILINVQHLINVKVKDHFFRENEKFLDREFFESIYPEWFESELIPTITAKKIQTLNFDFLVRLVKVLHMSIKTRRQTPVIILLRDIFRRILSLASMGQGSRDFFQRGLYVQPIINYIRDIERNIDEYRLMTRLGSFRLRDFQKETSHSYQIQQDCRELTNFINERFRDRIRDWLKESGIIKSICKYRGHTNLFQLIKQIIKKDSLYERPEQKVEMFKFFLKQIEFQTAGAFRLYQSIMVEANIIEKNIEYYSQQVIGENERVQAYRISRPIFGLEKILQLFQKNKFSNNLRKPITDFLYRLHILITIPDLEIRMLKELVEWIIGNIADFESIELSSKQANFTKDMIDCLMYIYDKNETLKEHLSDWVSPYLDCIFYRLPETEKLWDCLEIQIEVWDENQSLIEMKKLFLEHYLYDFDYDCEKLQKWNSIIKNEEKKKVVLEIMLRQEPCRDLSMLQWLKDPPSELNSQNGIQNNMKIIEIFRKWDLPVDSEMIGLLFQLMKLSEGTSSDEGEEEDLEKNQKYQRLLEAGKEYISQKLQINLFRYFIQTDESQLRQLLSSQRLGDLVNELWKNSFNEYEIEDKYEFFLVNFPESIENYLENFECFIKIFDNLEISEDESKLYEQLLSNCINYLIERENIPFQLNKVLLELIVVLLDKQYTTPVLYGKAFLNFINKKLYSNFTSSILNILGKLMKQKPIADIYIEQFQNDINEPSWLEKQTIKVAQKKFVKGPTGYVGLRNPHSVCYVNSFIQQIFHIPQFRLGIYETRWKQNHNKEEDLVLQMKKTFLNLQRKQTDSYLNNQFFSAFKDQDGGNTPLDVQMDVDEFRNILFDRIENLIIPPQENSKNFIQKLFVGKQATFIKSKECKHQSRRQQDFSSICVEVKGCQNLLTSLNRYFKSETLQGENSYFCEDCQKKVRAQKTLGILEYPLYLTFVLKRFQFLVHYRQKINSKFEFPFNDFQLAKGIKYNLKGIIVHQGLSEVGHYFSLIRLNGKWFQFNDNYIDEIKEHIVMRYGFGEEQRHSNRNAYLLIYEREDNQKKRQQIGERDIRYEGLKKEIDEINRSNYLNKKMHIFFNQHFQNLIKQVCRYSHSKAFDLLLQYIFTIKSKINNTQSSYGDYERLFSFYKRGAKTQIPKNGSQEKNIINFYKNSTIHVSIKILFSETLVELYSELDSSMTSFLKECLYCLYEQFSENAHYYHLFLHLGKKDKEVLQFLVEGCLLGRIMELSLGSLIAQDCINELRKTCEDEYPFGRNVRELKKRQYEKIELRYNKWKLVNFILESGINISPVEAQITFSTSQRKFKRIFEDCVIKPNINEISKMFCILTKKNKSFGICYVKYIREKLSNDKSEQLRKYLKAAKDLMKIDDGDQEIHVKQITNSLIKAMSYLENQKLTSSLDIMEQWVIKIGEKNEVFRKKLQQHEAELMKIFVNPPLKYGMVYRQDFYGKTDQKLKNRYHGLKFPLSNSQNSQLMAEKKARMTRLLKNNIERIPTNEWDSDDDLIDLKITKHTKLMKFDDKTGKFNEVRVDEASGIVLYISGKKMYRYDDCLTHWFDNDQQLSQTEHDDDV